MRKRRRRRRLYGIASVIFRSPTRCKNTDTFFSPRVSSTSSTLRSTTSISTTSVSGQLFVFACIYNFPAPSDARSP